MHTYTFAHRTIPAMQQYFTYPLYKDINLDFYRALGDGKVTDNMSFSMFLNPFRIYRGLKALARRLEGKKIKGNYKGEGSKTGGIVIFGNDGMARYMYPEVTGYELEVEDLLAAVEAVRQEQGVGVTAAAEASSETKSQPEL
jgi:hypothetical protein